MTELNAEHIEYIMKALAKLGGYVQVNGDQVTDTWAKKLKKFAPRVLEQARNELYRCKIGDLVTILQAFDKLWQAKLITNAELRESHEVCQLFLQSYLDQTKRKINAQHFADMLHLMGEARFNGVFQYEEAIISKLEREFIAFQADNYTFTVSNLLSLLTAFDRISPMDSLPKLVVTIVGQLASSIKNSDRDFLQLYRLFDRMELLQ